VQVTQVSLGKGEVSPIAAARTDQDFYSNALQSALNVFIRREGGASNRPGLEYVGPCLTNTPLGSYLLPFVYSNQQSYVCEFAAGKTQFYSSDVVIPGTTATITGMTAIIAGSTVTISVAATNSFSVGAKVTISGVIFTGLNPNGIWTVKTASSTAFTFATSTGNGTSLIYTSGGVASAAYTISNPYAVADLVSLRWAQSADVLNVVVSTQPLQQLKRVTASTFSFSAPTLLFGPFQDTNTDGTTTVYASGTQGTVTITASAPIFKPSHVGSLFSIQEQFLASINPWTAQQLLTANSASPVGYLIRSNFNIYKCVAAQASTDNYATGEYQPAHTQGTQADGNGQSVPDLAAVSGVEWQFVSTDTGVAQITQYISSTQVKAVIQSHKGIWANFPPSVVGGPVTAVGPFSFEGDGTTVTFTSLTSITTTDPNQFYVTVAGIFQDPSTFIISGTSITFFQAPANGSAISVAQVVGTLDNIYTYSTGALVPLTGLCLSTYWAFGSINPLQGYPSDVCYYNDRLVLAGTALQPQTFFASKTSDYLDFGVSNPQVDSDAITETINSRQQNPINNLLPLSNLLLGTASTTWRVTDSSGIGSITPNNISLLPQEFYGMQPIPALQTGTTVVYAQWGGRKIRDIIYQFYTDKFQGEELTVYAQENMFPYGTMVTRMAFSPEPYGLIFCVRSDGVMAVCTYLPEQKLVAWTRYITQGNFEDVQVIPENNSFSVYVIVGRTIGGVYQRYIEKFAPREVATNDDYFFVDSGLTYDGRNATSVTMTVAVFPPNYQANQALGVLTANTNNGWVGFQASDVALNNCIWLYDALGNRARVQIVSVTTPSSAVVNFLDAVPATLQNITAASWTFARTYFTGATNLIGQTVSIFADGGIQPQALVDQYGGITLPNASGVVHAGLPYVSQIQSMNLNVQGQESIRDKSKSIRRVSLIVDQSSGFYVGPDFTTANLIPTPIRQFEPYGSPPNLQTGIISVNIPSYPNDNGTVCIQQSDPVPLTVLGWTTEFDVGAAGP
jgi:hypothetical protein